MKIRRKKNVFVTGLISPLLKEDVHDDDYDDNNDIIPDFLIYYGQLLCNTLGNNWL